MNNLTNIFEAIEAQLQAQKDEIFFKDLLVKDLKQQLADAEIEIARLKEQEGELKND